MSKTSLRPLLLALATLFLAACGSETTQVRLLLQYDEAWPLTTFELSARDKQVRLHAITPEGTKTREFVVSIPDDWVGAPIVYTVHAYSGLPGAEVLYASGQVTLTAAEGEVREETIVLARTACAVWCTPGTTSCRNGSVVECQASESDCPRWGTPQPCSTGQTCSLGECSTTCVDECAPGDSRCAGPLGVESCGQADDDTCLDWQEPVLCSGSQTCSNGTCSGSCASECSAGTVRCRDNGISTCGDLNGDSCLEWGPSVACSATQSCQGNVGAPGSEGVAHCLDRNTCTDTCTAATCSDNILTTCGNYNLDSCREPSPGISCTSTDSCSVGSCDAVAGRCTTTQRAGSCDDNDACTVNDSCQSGRCSGTAMACPGRAPSCEAGVARTYGPQGMCSNGACHDVVTSEVSCVNGCDGAVCAGEESVVAEPQRLDARHGHTCAISRGEVWCWGNGSEGQLGDGRSVDSNVAVRVAGLSSPIAVAVGSEHSCAVLASGRVYCWGKNMDGQLGSGASSGTQPSPVAVQGVMGATQIALGRVYSCARTQAGEVYCWGRIPQQGGVNETALRIGGGLTDAAAIATGDDFACALLATGQVRCWGSGYHGQLGNGTETTSVFPVDVSEISTAIAISSGQRHTCVVLADGSGYCWGEGERGRLGNGGETFSTTPVRVTGDGFASIDCGATHSCGLMRNGTFRCWGSGLYGSLGTSNESSSLTPVAVSNLSGGIAIAAGYLHTCALTQTGLHCWGSGMVGRLGNGGSANSSTPVPVTEP